MGKIWLQTSDGKLIHLPIMGDDFNTPDDAVKIPVSILGTGRDRCYSGQVSISHPTYGSVTFNFDPAGRTGSCNQCGECCSHTVANCPNPTNCGYVLTNDELYHACQYLTIFKGSNKGIGKVGGTECSIRTTILDVFKGCAFFPDQASDIVNCPHCGFSFGG